MANFPLLTKFIPRKLSPRSIGLIVTGLVLVMYLLGNPLLDLLEFKTYDMRLKSARRAAPQDVAIVAIDEKSLATLGRWPWNRATMARLVQALDRLGVGVIAFDVFFAEAEEQRLLEQIERLEAEQGLRGDASPYSRVKQALASDRAFSQAIKQSGKVVLPIVFLLSRDEARHQSAEQNQRLLAGVQPHAVGLIKDRSDGRLDFPLPAPVGLLTNLPALVSAAKLLGHINTFPDVDGTVRRVPLVIRYQGLFFPSADVQAVRLYRGLPPLALRTTHYGIEGLEIGNQLVPTDEDGNALVHYYGHEQTVPTFSAADVFAGRVTRAQLERKIVLIGATAAALGDVRVTPYGPSFPGVEIRASVVQNLLRNELIRRPGWMMFFDLAILLALGATLSLLLARWSVREGVLLSLAAFAVYTAFTWGLFQAQYLWLNLVYPSVLVLLLFISSTLLKYFSTEKERRQIKGAFQRYVPAAVVDQIMGNIDNLSLGGDKRELTVLFSDLRDFTTVAETMSPEELVKLLNTYLTRMTDQVFEQHGLLDKYIGDAIMAVYGAPLARPDHALLACRTALGMMRALQSLQTEWVKAGLPAFDAGVGISTGPMIVGNMGSHSRFDYTVIGDAVNLGARIEALNKTYGTHILVSEHTYQQVRAEFPQMREVDVTQVKGRKEAVRLYELMLPWQYPHFDWLPEFHRAGELLRAGLPTKARPVFQHLSDTLKDPVSRYYVQRCQAPRRRTSDL